MTRNANFIDRSGYKAPPLELWDPVIVTKEDMDAEIERLASIDRPDNGRRQSLIVHPDWQRLGVGPGLQPGIRVTLEVLKPGEQSAPIRHNSTQVNFCIQGAGQSLVNGRKIAFRQYDVWNFPSMATYWHVNDTEQVHARLTYSNAPLLEKMNVHVVDEDPPAMLEAVAHAEERAAEARAKDGAAKDKRDVNPYGTFELIKDGGWLMPYETLINPAPVESKALHWPWADVKRELDKLTALGKDYRGRRLYLLFNRMTGRFNGTTSSFFATMTIRPPKIVDRPHRHVSAAINYYFAGRGRSTVEGKVYEWKAGDLMLSAPGWGVHNHASYDQAVYELTIQDQPLNIFMESLLWQEDLKHPFTVLGTNVGFETNKEKLQALGE
jgi:gentisate 1,2-dioxygenase